MSQDLLVDESTQDLFLQDGNTLILCPTIQDLTRQQVAITLRTIVTEWFANPSFGIPYFTEIFGKGNEALADTIFRNSILNTEGIISIINYSSSFDSLTRKFSVVFSARTESGVIKNAEIIV